MERLRISVIGGGYVGLITSACLAERGHFVEIVEIDESKVKSINAGIPPIYEVGLETLLTAHAGKNLRALANYQNLADSDISIISVGTPSSSNGSMDLSMLASASKAIGTALKRSNSYHIVAVKSTVPPGTTEKLIMPNVLSYSEKTSQDLGFVMNPEFLREGLAVEDFMNPDRIVVGSFDEKAGDIFQNIYNDFKVPLIRTNLITAEMIKFASNAFLATKISFSNEIGNICKRLDIDSYEVMNGVGLDHRIGPHFLKAGVGFGGSCFPKDVSSLIHMARHLGENPILLESVMYVNERQPFRMVELLKRQVGDIRGKRIAVLGLAFKNDTDDVRESRSILIIRELMRNGANVAAYDPKANQQMALVIPEIQYCSTATEALKGADACLVMTEWPQFKQLGPEFDLMRTRVIIEGRKILTYGDSEGICW